MDVAREVRLAKEAEAEMDLHVSKAGERVEKEIAKHTPSNNPNANSEGMNPVVGDPTMETANGPTYTAT